MVFRWLTRLFRKRKKKPRTKYARNVITKIGKYLGDETGRDWWKTYKVKEGRVKALVLKRVFDSCNKYNIVKIIPITRTAVIKVIYHKQMDLTSYTKTQRIRLFKDFKGQKKTIRV